MGYMRHHTIVVASWDSGSMERAHEKATRIFSWVSPLSPEAVNGYSSFFIPPDGSKEGWQESNEGDENRDRFISWLGQQRHVDNSSNLSWVEIQFGDDEYQTKIIRDNDEGNRQ